MSSIGAISGYNHFVVDNLKDGPRGVGEVFDIAIYLCKIITQFGSVEVVTELSSLGERV